MLLSSRALACRLELSINCDALLHVHIIIIIALLGPCTFTRSLAVAAAAIKRSKHTQKTLYKD